MDFDDGFAGMIHGAMTPASITNLQVSIRATQDLSSNLGLFGFQLIDEDGTTARTQTGDLLSPSAGFSLFEQAATDIDLETAPGSVAGMDYANITQFGVLFLDRDDITGAPVTFYLDDILVEGTTVPEPGTLGLVSLAGIAVFVLRRTCGARNG